jgi:hypothetical protein
MKNLSNLCVQKITVDMVIISVLNTKSSVLNVHECTEFLMFNHVENYTI